MAETAANVRVGIGGAVYFAPIGSTAPTDADTALDAAYLDLGFITEDGITEMHSDSVTDFVAWQNARVVRSATTSTADSIQFTMMETNGRALEVFHRGAQVTETASNKFRLNVGPILSDPRMWVLHVIDGSKLIRVSIKLGEVVERGDIVYANGNTVSYPVTIRCYPDVDGNTMQKFSNDVAWSAS